MIGFDDSGLILEDLVYRRKTGGKTIKGTVGIYAGTGYILGFVAGAVAGAYVANETLDWLASDAPTAVTFAVDGISAFVAGNYLGKRLGKIGGNIAVSKIEKILKEK